MARMSIDDKLLRDPRVLRLARACNWSRRETVGALLDVFAVAYDRERDTLPIADIDVAAERDGFADLMFEVDLAEQVRGGVRIKGAKERIKYLTAKAEAGRAGGLKSGESRRKSAKQKRSNPEAPANLPDPVPDLPPDPVPDQISDLSPACAIAPTPDSVPVAPAPAAPPPSPASGSGAADRESRRAVAAELRAELERERREVAAELGVTDHGLLAQDPGERDLAMHLVNAGPAGLAAARAQALHAIAMAGLEARHRDGGSLQWLTGAIFGERNFRRLVAMTPADARRERPAPKGSGAPAPARPRKKPAALPAVTVSAAELADVAAIAAEATARLFGIADGVRAPPASAATTDTDEQPKPARKPA